MAGKILVATKTPIKTMRSLIVLLTLVVAGSVLSPTQSVPDKGSVVGNIYTNKAIGVTWEFPANWAVQNNSPTAPPNTQVLLELLPGGTQSGESIAMVGINPGHFDEGSLPTPDPKTWIPLPNQNSSPNLSDLTLGNGLPVRRYDFKSAQEPARYMTFLSGPRKGYGVDFIILANSRSNLERMIRTLATMKIQPDWQAKRDPVANQVQSSNQLVEPIRISDKISNAMRLKHSIAPEYPPEARAERVQGTVRLLGHIDISGKIEDLYLLSGPEILCRPAIAAVSQWRYQPYLFQGKPIEVETTINVIFQMAN